MRCLHSLPTSLVSHFAPWLPPLPPPPWCVPIRTRVLLVSRTFDDIEIRDISLEDYIAVKGKYATYLPHTAGRYQKKRFRKATVSRSISIYSFGGLFVARKMCGALAVGGCWCTITL